MKLISSQEFSKSQNMDYVETSAKNSSNVEQAFLTLAKKIKSEMGNQSLANNSDVGKAKLSQSKSIKSGSKCC